MSRTFHNEKKRVEIRPRTGPYGCNMVLSEGYEVINLEWQSYLETKSAAG
jgi:hypothetical protein